MAVTINGTTGITLPTTAAPAFSAYQSSAQSPSGGTFTKVQYQTKEFDTNNNFDSTTNYRFTPTVAGYYQINGAVKYGNNGEVVLAIYKNGTAYKWGLDNLYGYASTVSCVMNFNGSTDYIELYVYIGTGGSSTTAASTQTWFNGCMVRSA